MSRLFLLLVIDVCVAVWGSGEHACHRLRTPRKFLGPGCIWKGIKKIFRERARPGDGRSDLQPAVGSWKSGFCWDTGLITQRLRLVIMTILDVFGMD